MTPYDGHGAWLPTHDPIVKGFPRTEVSPAEVTVTCTACDFVFESIESAGGPVEAWGEAFDEHVESASESSENEE